MSYSRNIARLKETSRENTRQTMINNTNAAQWEGQAGIKEAEKIATSLSAFSKHLHDWKVEDIEKKTAEGVTKAREVATANSQKILELSEELQRTKREDTRYQEIKAEMLELGGPNAYPDADRLAGLSPWQQVGYAKEKLRAFNETFPDKLAHSMQNSEKMLTISGVNFTPKELHDNNIQGLPFKEAASKVLAEDIRKAANVDRFSPELLAYFFNISLFFNGNDGVHFISFQSRSYLFLFLFTFFFIFFDLRRLLKNILVESISFFNRLI